MGELLDRSSETRAAGSGTKNCEVEREDDSLFRERLGEDLLGGRGQVAGVDVILAHRLLKNGLERKRAYLLLTEAALRWLGIDRARANLTAHVERYEHLGDVRCFVRDLPNPVSKPSARAAAMTETAAA